SGGCGHRFVLIEHRGRRSGRSYRTVLEVVRWRPDPEVVVVSGWGPAADWFRNVTAGGPVLISVGRLDFAASHRVLPPDEAFEVMADYEHRNRHIAPVVRRMIGYLVGWPYDGSGEARHRLVQQLPLVSLCPRAE
ncbi:MAG: nitroreductase family deazaflavin-dependent oxidoreductase, partial [Acidimicrobiales bacterium]